MWLSITIIVVLMHIAVTSALYDSTRILLPHFLCGLSLFLNDERWLNFVINRWLKVIFTSLCGRVSAENVSTMDGVYHHHWNCNLRIFFFLLEIFFCHVLSLIKWLMLCSWRLQCQRVPMIMKFRYGFFHGNHISYYCSQFFIISINFNVQLRNVI